MSDEPTTRDHSIVDALAPNRSVPAERTRRRWLGGVAITAAWIVNLAALAFLAVWMASDIRVANGLDVYLHTVMRDPLNSTEKVIRAALVMKFAAYSGGIIVYGLIWGPPRARGLRSWFAFVALAAAWLAIVGSRHDLSWFWQRNRLERQIDKFELVAAKLRENWPKHDDAMDPIGPFSAYPAGKPHALLPLTTPESRPSVAPFNLVERSPAGGLRFELVGRDAGSWLEWHPAGEIPATFIGALDTRREMQRSSRIASGWFVAQYQSELASSGAPAP